ncbi:MAG TPA: CadC-family transcriptional regulator, partial [Burkholderiaceae bacterium]
LPDKPSVAVLPFTNMSGDPEQDYFADGMVEDIITALARTRLFFVIARNSTFVYKGKAVDIKRVGRELGVRYVLEGGVRKSGSRVRITGQLIEVESGHHVWADRFEGQLEDVFELQDRVTAAIVSAMEPSVRRAEIERIRTKPPSSLRAFELVVRALPGLMPRSGRAGLDDALASIRRALELDPGYSMAKGLGAFACMSRIGAGYGSADDVKAGLRYAEEALQEQDDDPSILAYAGAALATLGYRAMGFRVLGFRYDEAQRAIEHALTLGPNLLMVQFCAGQVKGILGDGDAALGHFEQAMRISPLDPAMSGLIACTGGAHLISGRYEQALAAAQRAIQASPSFALSHRVLVLTLGYLGRIEEAKVAAQILLELAPEFTVSRYRSMSPVKDPAYRRRAAEIYRAAGVPK